MEKLIWKEKMLQNLIGKEEEELRKKWYLDSYWWKLEYIDYGNNIIGIRWIKTKNVTYFLDYKWNLIFNIVWLIKDFWEWNNSKEKFESWKKVVDKCLQKLGYKWYKDQNWYYHMINLKTWKELNQTSIEYYEIFRQLYLVDNKEVVVERLNPEKYFKKFMKYWQWVYKQIVDILEDMNKEKNLYSNSITTWIISSLEYFSYLNLWLVEKQDILKYTKQVLNLDYFEKYYNNEWFKLLEDKKFKILLWEWKGKYDWERILFEKYKTYEISLKPSVENIDLILEKVLPFVEKLELTNTKNKEKKLKIKNRYKELKEFLKKEKEKLEEKSKNRKKIVSLKNDIINNLA